MHIVILAIGSRGDVQPYVALGRGLHDIGYDVRVATSDEFEPFIRAHGLGFTNVGDNPRTLLEHEAGLAWLESGRNPIAFVRRLARLVEPHLVGYMVSCWQACQGADAVIYSPLGVAGYHAAEKLGIPCFAAMLQPFSRTRFFPSVLTPTEFNLGAPFNVLTHLATEQLFWQPFRGATNYFRQDILGLPPIPFFGPSARMQREQMPILYGYSPSVLPKPPDWPSWVHVTGYWFLDSPTDWQPPTGLVDFLNDGTPPVYVGFGSMKARSAERLTDIVLTALKRAGLRGILLTGWAGLGQGDLPDNVYRIESIPHDWLFPRVAAVVHHGGAGTTSAGLRAGIPSVLVPFFADQPFWGRRVAALGVGPPTIPFEQLSAERLTMALRIATSDSLMRARSATLGGQVRAENGVARAVEVVQHQLRVDVKPVSRWAVSNNRGAPFP